jgi:hypothetical protein
MSNKEMWNHNLEKAKLYINTNNKRPSNNDKDQCIKKLAHWIGDQQTGYKIKRKAMKHNEFRIIWYNFVTDPKYKQYFDQDIIKPDPLPIEIQNNINIIEPNQIHV